MNGELRISTTSMILTSLLAIILGFVMLVYPGGTMVLMTAAFRTLQIIISVFALAYGISAAMSNFKRSSVATGAAMLIAAVAATLLIWVFNVAIVYVVIAAFFIVSGVGEIFAGASVPVARYFFIMLGLMNIIVGAAIIKYPVILPLLLAWYVLFWGIARLCLSLEIKRSVA